MLSTGRGWSCLFRATSALLVAVFFASVPVFAQEPQRIVDVRIEQEGRVLDDRLITGLIETTVGEPLSLREVRETITHLTSLNRFEDVQVFQEPAGDGIRLRYVLMPLHPVDRVDFRGVLGVSEDDLRQVITERFGLVPSAGRLAEVTQALLALYRDRGYLSAEIAPVIEETHAPDRATMAFQIRSGPRVSIARLDVDEVDGAGASVAPGDIGIRVGDPYDNTAIQLALDRYAASLRSRGYYEARALHTPTFNADGSATVRITVDRGPLVTVTFAGDALPEGDRERLVPVQAEGSADEDLLEDANLAMEAYLQARGYRDAVVSHARTENAGTLTITFTVNRGSRYVVDDVAIVGNAAIATPELLKLVAIQDGAAFVQATAAAAANAIRDAYRARGFTRATLQTVAEELAPSTAGADRHVSLRFNVTEGPQTNVAAIAFEGNEALSDEQLHAVMTTAPGRPYSETDVVLARDRIDLEYRNLGYESIIIEPDIQLADDDTRATILFRITEGPQVIVDHVIIVGNERTDTAIIERELLLRPGEPLGYLARLESQQRLAALGLFRRVAIEELRHGGEPRRDVLVQVDESPPTTISYGGGVEGGTRLRPTGDSGAAEERFEVAPRGFFEISRRNLGGKNRSITLFGRVSLRSRDIVLTDGFQPERPSTESSYGFNEYRVLSTFREPRILGTGTDLLVTGVVDQAIRSSFNFIRRQARSEIGMRLSPRYSVAAFYSFERTELFDERFAEEEKPLIDRLFPEVRLSKFSGSVLRDTRNDVVDTQRGSFLVANTDVAARTIGSEVGFVKTYVQAFRYISLASGRRRVLAIGGRLGAAHGFPREVPDVGVVQDLPASERFFAGGDTTVRGFSLDRLGTTETISPSGFPTGGNGLVVVNAELRIGLFGAFDGVTFVDAGNVFARARDIQVTDLRPSAGFGVHYRSPIGPIRVELGFNLDRRELVPGLLERRSVLHISLGQAF